MAYEPIVNVNITISDVQVSAEGFGTPLFITSHRKDQGRVLEYSSAADVGTFYGTDSAAYKAALKAFGQRPSITSFKVGRRDAELRLLPTNFSDGDVVGFTVTNKQGISFAVSYTVQALDTATDISNGLKTNIETSPDALEDCTPVVQGSTLILRTALNGNEWQDSYFTVTSYIGDFSGADFWRGTESASQVYNEISESDNDFYFIASDDNSIGFVTGLAAIVQTENKLYFVSDSDEDNIATVSENDTSLFGQLSSNNYTHTVTLFHQDAGQSSVAGDSENKEYPELAWIGANAVYDPGSVTWANLTLSAISESKVNSTGRRLTPTQKSNLNSRNSNYIEYDSGNTFTRYGQTAGNEWIDTVRGVHWQTSDLTTNIKALLLGQKGGKITYDGQGIARIREVIASSLQRGVNRNLLSSYDITMPRLSDISTVDKLARILNNVRFSAQLAGAIHEVVIQGTVSES